MSVLAFAGAELGATAELTSPSGITIDSTVVHGGKYSYRVSVGGSGTLIFTEHTTPIYFRGYFRYPTGLAATTRIFECRDGGGAAHVAIDLHHDTSTLHLIGALGTASGATAIAADTWHRLEILIHQAASYVEVRLNQRQEIAATLTIGASQAQIAIMSTSGNVYWDDIHVTEDGWPGPGFVLARQGRSGTPTYDDFTKTGGAIDAIWSETPTNAATNAASTAVSQAQTMLVEAISQVPIAAKYGTQRIAPLDTIFGAKIYANGRRVGTSPEFYLIRVMSGAVTHSPVSFSTLDVYRDTEIFPATLAQLDAMEIGGSRGAVGVTANLTLNEMWLMVSYATAPVPMSAFTGFEVGSLAEITSPLGSLTIDTTQVRSGVYSAKGIGPSVSFVIHPEPIEAATIWVRAYVFITALPPIGGTILSLRDANGVTISAVLRASGGARLIAGASSINGSGTAFVVGAWNYVELIKRASLLPGDGSATLWVNAQQLTLPIAETGGATVLAIGEVNFTGTLWFDDLALSATGRIGPGRVLARQGIAGTTLNSAWTKTGGAIEVVWSNTPSNPATYAQAVAGIQTAQTVAVNPRANGGASLSPTDTIVACRIVAMARYDAGVSGGPVAVRYRVPAQFGIPALTKDTRVALTSTVSRLVYGDIFSTVVATLNDIQIGGIQSVPGGPSLMRIEDIWLMVAYMELEFLDLPLPSTPAPVAIVEIIT